MADVLVLRDIRKSYGVGTPVETEVLHGLSLTLGAGELVALTGPSGSGKSTLLNIVGLLDRPTSGTVTINGTETSGLPDSALTALRGHTIGFVFQYHYLISAFTAAENVMMPLLVDKGHRTDAMQDRAYALLDDVGLTPWRTTARRTCPGGSSSALRSHGRWAMNPNPGARGRADWQSRFRLGRQRVHPVAPDQPGAGHDLPDRDAQPCDRRALRPGHRCGGWQDRQ